MGAPFQHARNKLRQTAQQLKGHLEPSYHIAKRLLGHVDREVQTMKAIHSFVAPVMDLTAQGRILNNKIGRASNSYDTIRGHVANADKVGRATVGVINELHKRSVGIGL
jgi:hypothetical protein